MSKQTIEVIFIIFVTGIVAYIYTNVPNKIAQKPDVVVQMEQKARDAQKNSSESGDWAKTYLMSDISKHSSEKDCWLLIDGKVFDVTDYIASSNHPGGKEIVKGCGIDSTSMYNKRPQDGKSHSDKAREMLKNYYIGNLTGEK